MIEGRAEEIPEVISVDLLLELEEPETKEPLSEEIHESNELGQHDGSLLPAQDLYFSKLNACVVCAAGEGFEFFSEGPEDLRTDAIADETLIELAVAELNVLVEGVLVSELEFLEQLLNLENALIVKEESLS